MAEYRHHVTGFFADRHDAQNALSSLVKQGLPRDRLQIVKTDSSSPGPSSKDGNHAVLKEVLVDGAIGTAVGTGLGALAEVALIATNVTLFVANPLLAPLMLLGWGAGIGGLIGATTGAVSNTPPGVGKKHGWLSTLVHDAISSGQIVLVVQTRTEQETRIARELLQSSVGDTREVSKV